MRKVDLMSEPSNPNVSLPSSGEHGYRLINMDLLGGLFENLLCPKCKSNTIELQVCPVRGSGMNATLVVHCVRCDSTQGSIPTCEMVQNT